MLVQFGSSHSAVFLKSRKSYSIQADETTVAGKYEKNASATGPLCDLVHIHPLGLGTLE